ncbi:MAG: hypothetical protein ACYC4L_17495 [Chloroflexota bacterium]
MEDKWHPSQTPPVKTSSRGSDDGAAPIWHCPECESRISPGYEETSEGIIKTDGTWHCRRCGYYYEKPRA